MINYKSALVALLLTFGSSAAVADTTAIVHGRLLTITGGVIEDGTLVLEKGRIAAVGGPATKVPAGAHIHDARGMTVYPGLIDIGSSIGLVDPDNMKPNPVAAPTPAAVVADAIKPMDYVGVERLNGITNSVVTNGYASAVPGHAALIQLIEDPAAIVLRRDSGLVLNLEALRKDGYPSTPFGAAGYVRQLLTRAQELASSGSRPDPKNQQDVDAAAFIPHLGRNKPLMVYATTDDDVGVALDLAEQFDLKLVLCGLTRIDRSIERLAASGMSAVVGPLAGDPPPGKRFDHVYRMPARLASRGIPVAIATLDRVPGGPRNLPYQAGIAAAFDLPHAEAMKAITLAPAQAFGVEKDLGSLEVGKLANVVVSDGDPLDVTTDVKQVFINGVSIPMSNRQTRLRDEYDHAASSMEGRIDAEISASGQAQALLQELTSKIGARVSGTPEGERAETFAHEQFKRFGYGNARFEPFVFDAWTRGPLSLEIDGRVTSAIALGHAPAKTELTAQLVDIGNGNPEDYAVAPERVRGKVVLAYSGNLPGTPKGIAARPRYEKIAVARRYGAAGVILISAAPGNAVATGSGRLASDTGPSLPAVMVGHDDGMSLKTRLARKPLPVEWQMTNSLFQATPRNVIATLEGSEPSDEHIVFGGHLDSWDLATGALDNGVGAVTVLDVARALKAAGYRPRRTIHFVLYMGEEQGMYGSQAHVDALAREGVLPKVKYMFNTDMSIDPVAFNIWGFPARQAFYDSLAARVRTYVPDFEGRVVSRPMPGGDSDPYQRRGIPILYLDGRLTPELLACQHSACDRLDIVRRDQLQNTVRISAQALKALADADELPAQVLEGAALETYKQANALL